MIFFYEIHIHDISGIQYKDQPFKMLSDLGKHIFFLLRQQIGALLVFIVLILSGCSSNDHKSRIVSGCRLTDKLLRKLHFHLAPWLISPADTSVKGMLLYPCLIDRKNLGIKYHLP